MLSNSAFHIMTKLLKKVSPKDYRDRSEALNNRWQELCDHYLPFVSLSSIWRYSRESSPDDPEQGWKLHVSATILDAVRVLRAVGPYLQNRGVLFKAPASLHQIGALNSGIHYGYSQVGKCFTIYPRTPAEAKLLAGKLHRLTRKLSAPCIPFDLRFRPGSSVFYRYGAFKAFNVAGQDAQLRYVMRDPQGKLVPDSREDPSTPSWVNDPFTTRAEPEPEPESLLKTTFKAFRALAQRGKGGVYQAVDLSSTPARLIALKQGRKYGEVEWDGRDGFWRIQHEGRVLSSLRAAGVSVPRVFSSFQAENNYYLALEFIEGESFEKWLIRRKRRLGIDAALRRSIEISLLVSSIHRAGWVWRDCKPRNIILTKDGTVRPIDFEGACPVDAPDPLPWGTPAYAAPEADASFRGQSRLPEDLYALGVTLHIVFFGRPPATSDSSSLIRLRRNIPKGVSAIVAQLLAADPEQRPSADSVVRRLSLELKSFIARRVSQGPVGSSLRPAQEARATEPGGEILSLPAAEPVRRSMGAG